MLAVSEILARRDVLQVVKTQKEERHKMEWFLDTVARLESVAPGMVFGTVDVVCCGCGETLGETWVQFNVMPVEGYPAGVARYRVS